MSLKLFFKQHKNLRYLMILLVPAAVFYIYPAVPNNKKVPVGNDRIVFERYLKLAEKGDAVAQNEIGIFYETGRGVTLNYEEAFKWYQRAVDQGVIEAHNNLALLYDQGLGVPQDREKAFKLYEKVAKYGYLRAIAELGRMYKNGFGVSQDDDKGFYYIKKAAEMGNAFSQTLMGLYYTDGKIVPRDYRIALDWYMRAAIQNYPHAFGNIGQAYEGGFGVALDYIEAGRWYKRGADLGSEFSKEWLDKKIKECSADLVPSGDVNYKLPACAVAAGGGDPEGMHAVGMAYWDFRIMERDDDNDRDKSIFWTRKSAESGFSPAQLLLGLRFLKPEPPQRPDYVEAYAWLSVAREQPDRLHGLNVKALQVSFEIIDEEIIPDDLEKAQARAKIYIEKYSVKK